MHGVCMVYMQEDAFRPQRVGSAPDPRLAASVYLAGGWYKKHHRQRQQHHTSTHHNHTADGWEGGSSSGEELDGVAGSQLFADGATANGGLQSSILNATSVPIVLEDFYPCGSPPVGLTPPGSSAEHPDGLGSNDTECVQGRWYATATSATAPPGTTATTSSRAAVHANGHTPSNVTPPSGGLLPSQPPVSINEEYLRAPELAPSRGSDAAGFSSGFGQATGGLADHYGFAVPVDPSMPCPISRIALRGFSGMWVLHDRGTGGNRGGGGRLASEGRIEIEVDGVNVTVESFGTEGNHASRLAVCVGSLEIRDCGAHQEGGGGGKWLKILSVRRPEVMSGTGGAVADVPVIVRPPGPAGRSMPAATVLLDSVRPDPEAEPELEEYRLAVALLPLRLRLDQDVVTFLQAFFGAVAAAIAAMDDPLAAAGAGGAEPAPAPYFQRVEIRGTAVMVDYRPRRVDIAALREGCFTELINLVPWGGVDLVLKPLRLSGVEGWDGIGIAAATEWLQHIARTQAHKFLTGVAPIRSVVRVGGAVAGLLAVPVAHIGAASRRGSSAHDAADGGSSTQDGHMSRALRRSTAGFVRALVYEALGLGATMAAGAQMVLTGGTPVSLNAPNTVLDGLRAAAGELNQGFGVAANALVVQPVKDMQMGDSWKEAARKALKAAPTAAAAPASAAVAAVRYTLLGVRSAMDPERRMEQ